MMPEVSGYDVLREMTLSGLRPDLPVMVLTNFPEPRNEEERRLLEQGLVLDVVAKTAVHDNPKLLPHVLDCTCKRRAVKRAAKRRTPSGAPHETRAGGGGRPLQCHAVPQDPREACGLPVTVTRIPSRCCGTCARAAYRSWSSTSRSSIRSGRGGCSRRGDLPVDPCESRRGCRCCSRPRTPLRGTPSRWWPRAARTAYVSKPSSTTRSSPSGHRPDGACRMIASPMSASSSSRTIPSSSACCSSGCPRGYHVQAASTGVRA